VGCFLAVTRTWPSASGLAPWPPAAFGRPAWSAYPARVGPARERAPGPPEPPRAAAFLPLPRWSAAVGGTAVTCLV